MSLSKKMIAAGKPWIEAPHPLAGWKSAREWRESTPGRWLNPIGIDLATLAEPGFTIRESLCPGHVQIGKNSFTQGRWAPDPLLDLPDPFGTPDPELPEIVSRGGWAEAAERSRSVREDLNLKPRQLSLFD